MIKLSSTEFLIVAYFLAITLMAFIGLQDLYQGLKMR